MQHEYVHKHEQCSTQDERHVCECESAAGLLAEHSRLLVVLLALGLLLSVLGRPDNARTAAVSLRCRIFRVFFFDNLFELIFISINHV